MTRICGPACWTATPCPECGTPLPPRGRAVPMEQFIGDCCDEARMGAGNRRHLWGEDEADDYAEMVGNT